jgi:hypothetical protein
LRTDDLDLERRIREGLFHDADEFDDVLRHSRKKREMNRKSRRILPIDRIISKPILRKPRKIIQNLLQYL